MSQRRRRQERKKSGKLLKFFSLGVIVFCCLVLVSAIFGYRWVRGFLRSDDFRVLLSNEAGKALEAEAQFTPFLWDGWSVRTEKLSASGEGQIAFLEASGLEATVDVGAIWDRVYRLQDILVREIEVKADFKKSAPKPEKPAEVPVEEMHPSSGKSHFWDRFLPNEFEMTGLRIAKMGGSALSEQGEWLWAGTSAEVEPGSSRGAYDVEITGGKIDTPLELLPQVQLKNVKARFAGEQLFLREARLEALERASLELSGDFDFQKKTWNLKGDLAGATCEELVSADWKQRLLGEIDSSFRVKKSAETEPEITGSLQINRGILTALPILDKIAAYTGALRFRRLVLSDARLDFRKMGDEIELKNISLISEGLVHITGHINLRGDEITLGQLRVGITPGTLAHLPGAETKVFTPGEKGLLWTPVSISGTVKKPQEDLSERLIAAAGERMFELIPETGELALRFTGKAVDEATKSLLDKEALTGKLSKKVAEVKEVAVEKGREAAEKGAEKLLEGGAKVLEKGSDVLFDFFGN